MTAKIPGAKRGGHRKGAGRPRKAPADLASVRIVALATPAQAAAIDAVRGEQERGPYLLAAGLRAAKRRRSAVIAAGKEGA